MAAAAAPAAALRAELGAARDALRRAEGTAARAAVARRRGKRQARWADGGVSGTE